MTTDELWGRYNENFPHANPEVARALGRALYRPEHRSAQDALPPGRSLNIFDLSPFANGWEFARSDGEWTAWRNANIPGGE